MHYDKDQEVLSLCSIKAYCSPKIQLKEETIKRANEEIAFSKVHLERLTFKYPILFFKCVLIETNFRKYTK